MRRQGRHVRIGLDFQHDRPIRRQCHQGQVPDEGRDDDEHLCDRARGQYHDLRCGDWADCRVCSRERIKWMADWTRHLEPRRADCDCRGACNSRVGKARARNGYSQDRKGCAITADEPDSVAGGIVFRLRQFLVLRVVGLDFTDVSGIVGLSATSAALVLATYTVAFTVAIPVFGLLSRAHDRRGWLAVCAALSGAGTLGMAWAPLLMPHGWIAIAAFGLGSGFTLGQ
jgi:hypothetical protein